MSSSELREPFLFYVLCIVGRVVTLTILISVLMWGVVFLTYADRVFLVGGQVASRVHKVFPIGSHYANLKRDVAVLERAGIARELYSNLHCGNPRRACLVSVEWDADYFGSCPIGAEVSFVFDKNRKLTGYKIP
jgi:hypothetical protein